MALPELVANSTTPGSVVALGTLTAEAAKGAGTLKVSSAAPTALQATGQFRVVIDKEIFLVTAGGATTTWTAVPEQEGSTGAAHLVGAQIFHFLTAGALKALMEPGTWKKITLPAKAEVFATLQEPEARTEGNGTNVRLRGAVETKEEIKAGETLFTLPEGCRPSAVRWLLVGKLQTTGTGTIEFLKVANTGIVTSAELVQASRVLLLTGSTFDLT